MPYVQRDGSGTIIGCFANLQVGLAEELLSPNDASLIAFLNAPPPPFSDRMDQTALKILFNHENRVRVLEGKAAITMQQFKTALLTLLGG